MTSGCGSSTERSSSGIFLIIRLSRSSWGGVKTPSGLQRLGNLLGLAELEDAGLLGDNGALVDGGQAGDKLGHKLADLLWVQVTNFLRNVNKGGENLLVALLITFLEDTSSTANLHWKLLAGSISNKLARLLLNILGGTGGFIHSSALLWSLAITDLLNWLVAFLDSLIESLLFKSDGT